MKVLTEQVEWGGQCPHTNTNLAITQDNILRQTVIVDPTEGESKAFNKLKRVEQKNFEREIIVMTTYSEVHDMGTARHEKDNLLH